MLDDVGLGAGPRDRFVAFMSNDKYTIATRPPQEPTEKRLHVSTLRISIVALIIALLAAGGSIWQTWEVRQTRFAANKAIQAQAADVERSRKAAEDTARAASQLAEAVGRSAAISGSSAEISREFLRR
jgi:hypothetical protein